jgi:GntR family transcriptional regulator
MYRKIAGDMRQKIESGELGRGAQLPSEIELREQYEASRNTIRAAVKMLTALGLVEIRPGQGAFVVEKIDPFVTTLGADSGFGGEAESALYAAEAQTAGRTLAASRPAVEVQQASGMLASELQLAEGSHVVSRHQQRYIDGIPHSLQTVFYPMSLVEQGATRLIQAGDIPEGVARYLEALGIRQASQRDTITVRPPSEIELHFFKLPSDGRVPVIEIRRAGFDESNRLLRFTVTVYPADRNKFVLSTTNPSAAIGEASVAGHVFISYVREDSRQVDRLQQALEAVGVPVWRDTADLWPGQDWRVEIRRAIKENTLVFIACFSQASISRHKSYQNEELVLAIEEMRLRSPEDPWLIPVRLSECEIPDREIGAGRTLTSIQRADLFGDRTDEGTERLVTTILRILGRHAASYAVINR